MPDQIAIGPHAATFDPPSTVLLTFSGDIEDIHAAKVIEACAHYSAGQPFTILLHTPGMKSVTPKARKVFADGFKDMPLVAAGFTSASIRTRAIATFVVAAINILRTEKMAVGFFEGDDPARVWAAERLADWKA